MTDNERHEIVVMPQIILLEKSTSTSAASAVQARSAASLSACQCRWYIIKNQYIYHPWHITSSGSYLDHVPLLKLIKKFQALSPAKHIGSISGIRPYGEEGMCALQEAEPGIVTAAARTIPVLQMTSNYCGR